MRRRIPRRTLGLGQIRACSRRSRVSSKYAARSTRRTSTPRRSIRQLPWTTVPPGSQNAQNSLRQASMTPVASRRVHLFVSIWLTDAVSSRCGAPTSARCPNSAVGSTEAQPPPARPTQSNNAGQGNHNCPSGGGPRRTHPRTCRRRLARQETRRLWSENHVSLIC